MGKITAMTLNNAEVCKYGMGKLTAMTLNMQRVVNMGWAN
jgi:hypothetical protein